MKQNNPTKPQLKAKYWLSLLPLLVILQLLLPSKVWVVLLVGLGGAWLTAYIWARILSNSLHLEREMRFGWAHVGDRLEERFTLINRGLAPALWVEIADFSTLPDYDVSQVTAIGGEARNSWKTSQVCTQRGLFTLGPTRMKTGDPLGFYHVTFDLSGSAVLMVTPPVIPLPQIEITPGGRAGEGRRSRQDPFERTVSTSGVRSYTAGDPLRWIHWPTSVRKQQLYVHNFDSTPASDWWIFLDLNQAVQLGEDWNSTVEHGVILAASLADLGLRQGHAVGFSASGDRLIWLPPTHSADQRMLILRELALIKPGEVAFANLLEAARLALRHGASLIIITPDRQANWIEPLSMLLRNWITPTVLLFDPLSYQDSLTSHQFDQEHTRLQAALAGLGISPYIIRREMLDRPEARPGHQGEWEWRVTGFGRAIPIHKPADLSWKKLGR